MFLSKTSRIRQSHNLPQLQLPTSYLINKAPLNPLPSSSNSYQLSCHYSIFRRLFSISPELSQTFDAKSPLSEKPLSEFFKHTVGSSDKIESGAVNGKTNPVNAELIEKLRNSEEEVRSLSKKNHEKDSKSKLHSDRIVSKGRNHCLSGFLFGEKKMEKEKKFKSADFGVEDTRVYKKLSPDMQSFAHCLYQGGYFKDANFLPGDKFDLNCFEVSYAREFMKFAAVKFGKDHQEIAKWLSGSDLKKVAFFGCPSLGQKTIYSAKHLRGFFKIDEPTVCRNCVLKDSCKVSNKKTDVSKLCLSSVIRVLVIYALESVPSQLVVPEEIKISVSRLLNEVINLSRTVSPQRFPYQTR